jgi:hypothetical protein
MLLGLALCLLTITYAVAEDVVLSTYYPSPKGVYDEVQANSFREYGNGVLPASPFILDPDATTSLQAATFFGSLTLNGRSISTWAQVLPPGSVLMIAVGASCPSGFTKLAGGDLGRFPRIAAAPGGSGGADPANPMTGPPDLATGATAGPTDVASMTHRHRFMPRYRDYVFCERN